MKIENGLPPEFKTKSKTNKINSQNGDKEGNIVMKKAYSFALRIVKLYKYLIKEHKEYELSRQLLKSGTAVGALIKEAEHGQSKADFISKMNIALKEANETEFWLNILKDSDYLDEKSFESIEKDCIELIRLLASIVKTTKENHSKK